MTFKEVKTMLASVGIPTAYYQFPEGTEQAPPFVCFFYANSNDFLADNSNFQKIEHLIIELYTDNKDFALEAAMESALAGADLVWTRAEEWLDDERMLEVVYETDVVITEEEETNGE